MSETTKHNPWRSTAVQGLYINTDSGTYYARYRQNGKRAMCSHETKVWTVAKLKHASLMEGVEKARQSGGVVKSDLRTMGQLAAEYLRLTDEDPDLTQSSRVCRHNTVDRLRAAWKGKFDPMLARDVTKTAILDLRSTMTKIVWTSTKWKSKKVGYSPAVINKTLMTLRALLDLAVEARTLAQSPFPRKGAFLSNNSRVPELPTRAQMEAVFADVALVPEGMEGDSRLPRLALEASEHARFLAYSGMRLEEGNAARFEDVQGDVMRVRGTKTDNAERVIPVFPHLKRLLEDIKARRGVLTGPILVAQSSRAALTRACRRLKLPNLRHHDLRHYFTTVCIESGVDIPTVAGWLGHGDGGALLMERYHHLRQEHSIAAARKVNFDAVPTSQSNAA